jgi:carbamoyl-phosphate synthase small subunit
LKAVLILKDGTVLEGIGFGAKTTRVGELVFNTSMIGYQEALTDPSYAGQILLLTYPLIGNYGISSSDFESERVQVEGFCVREYCERPSHRGSIKTIDEFLNEFNVPGIAGIDTRFVVRKIRNYGVMPAIIATYDEHIDVKKLLDELVFNYSSINFVEKVTTQRAKQYGRGKKKIVLIDYGVKMGIVRELVAREVRVIVVPSYASVDEIAKYEPDGILLSNGPGDPAILTNAHSVIRKLAERDYPIFGICLGHQLLAHAFGGRTFKLKFGHRGSNHPVVDLIKNRVCITTQNHGFAVDEKALPKDFEITHYNLNDKTIEGTRHKTKPIFSVQYHPEAAPGPHDSKYLFDEFVKML